MKQIFFLFSLLALPALVDAASSVSQSGDVSPAGRVVRDTVAEIRKLVIAEKGRGSEDELNQKIEQIIIQVFDFDEMSKRSLGPNWRAADRAQQTEFIELFKTLLSRTYIERIKEVDKHEVAYEDERFVDGKALIRTKVKKDSGETFPIDYRLYERGGKWRVYDVVIENVGLVSNYRHEFAGIIRKKGFDGLLADLKQRSAA